MAGHLKCLDNRRKGFLIGELVCFSSKCTHLNTNGNDNMPSTTLTVRLSPELKARLGKLAEQTQRTKSFLAGEAIGGYVERELEIIAGIERGLDDMEAGGGIPHEDVMADIGATIKKAKTKRRKR